MMHISRKRLGVSAMALATVLTTACSESLSLDTTANAEARLLMQREESPAPSTPDSTPASSPRAVREDTVQSFAVSVVAVEFLRAGASDTSENSAAWTRVNLSSASEIDFMALPNEAAGARLIASARLDAGSYARVRLVVTNPRIRFKGAVAFGIGNVLQGDTEYQVRMRPSETRITIEAGFTVESESSADVGLVFQTAETLGQVTMSATGQLEMVTRIRAR